MLRRRAPRGALARCWAAGLAALISLVSVTVQEAWARPALAKPAAAAASMASSAPGAARDCHYRSTVHQPGVHHALAGELITRIETRDPRYATVSGVHVGDRLEQAQQAYGKRLVSAPHPYFDQGRMLSVYLPDRRFALVMETNNAGRIITRRGVRVPEVGRLKGCAHPQAAAPVSLIPVADGQRRLASAQ